MYTIRTLTLTPNDPNNNLLNTIILLGYNVRMRMRY